MLKNRSVPTDVVLPHITYKSVADALAWLTKTFGFVEHYRYGESDGNIQGAQMHRGDAWIMINSARPGAGSPAQVGSKTQSLTIFVDDVDAHYEAARSAGAKIVEDLHVTEYGERQYGVEDLEGHHWLFSCHARNVSPDEWGAKLNQVLELTEVAGRTEWIWTPRSYTVQSEPGAVTGAQANFNAGARAALEQSLRLLDELYSLLPNAEPTEPAKAQAEVRSRLTSLADEFGVTGDPRVPRVDELFRLLLGSASPGDPGGVATSSSLGQLRQRLGLERRYVNSVADEQNLSNYLLLADYLTDLKESWGRDQSRVSA
jgi:uncharacterized glyoxalase superfamily protein PhnB